MTLREENAARARQALLVAARDEFGEHGFDKGSIRRIARAAGVATGTVFNYFTNKTELLRQVLYEDLESACVQALASPEDIPINEQLTAMARVFLEMFTQQPNLSRVLLKESLFATGPSGVAFKAQVERFADDAKRRIERSSRSASPEVATLMFISAYYFSLIHCLASDPPNLDASVHLLRVQLNAIFGDRT